MPENSTPDRRTRHVICSAADLPPGARRIVRLGGQELGVFNVKGKFHALQNRCPHKGGPLCHGRVGPLVVATDVYHIEYQREQEILKCPWHQWEFDITSGRAICDPKLRVKTYRVCEEQGDLVIYLDR